MRNRGSSQKKIFQLLIGLSLFSIITFILVSGVNADGWDPNSLKGTGLTDRPLFSILLSVVNWAITFIGILAVIIFIYGGFVYLTSQGENDKIELAKKIILYAVVGIVVAVLGVVAVTTINNIITGKQSGAGSGPGMSATGPGGGAEAPIQNPVAPAAQDVSGGDSGGEQPYVRRSGGGAGGALPVSPDMMQ